MRDGCIYTGCPYSPQMELPSLFEWGDDKAAANEVKHGVPFDYATRTFLDPDCLIISTARPEDGEARSKVIGTIEGRLYVAVYVMRGEICRIISARRTNASEERRYHGYR